jgi:hypothetical protein
MLINTLTLITPLNHNGSETQQNPDSVKQVTKNEEFPKRLTLYIPSNFDIDVLVRKSPPDFNYHRDNFVYLVHLITDIPSRNKDVEMDYVPFYSSLIQRRVREYRKHLDYLVNNGVLLENRQYIVNKQSRSFKFTSTFDTPIKPIFITKATLIKSILKFINLDNKLIDNCFDNNVQELSYLTRWFDRKLIVDYKEAEKYLKDLYEVELTNILTKQNAMRRFNSRHLVLLKLQRGEFAHTIDKTAGRLHTVLTQLKGELRQFITYDNKSLVAVDITNSQPYLSTVLFNSEKFAENNILLTIKHYNKSFTTQDTFNPLPYYVSKNVNNAKNSKNINNYIEIVKSGQLYEEFGKILLERRVITDDTPVRKQAKTIIFSSIFSPNQAIAYNQEMKIFKEVFPDVYEIYRSIKQNEHRTLACLLQNLEAKLVLHIACKIISEERPEIPLFTLHDSIITTEGNENYVYQVLYDVLLIAIGIPATLKFEKWKKVA